MGHAPLVQGGGLQVRVVQGEGSLPELGKGRTFFLETLKPGTSPQHPSRLPLPAQKDRRWKQGDQGASVIWKSPHQGLR